jgi:Predicted exporters of the RND superfamily
MHRFFKHPWIIISISLALTVFFGIQLKDIHLDNSVRQFFPQKHPSYSRLLETENQFGSTVVIGVALETDQPSIITADNLKIIDAITKKVTALDNIDSVDSLSNIDYVYGSNGSLAEGTLLGDDYTGSDADIARVKERLADWNDMYRRVILSDDGHSAQMQITIDSKASEKARQTALNQIRNIALSETKGTNLTVTFYGDPVLTESARSFMLSDLIRLIPLVTLVVLITLFFSFKTLDGTLLPLIAVLMGTIWACGLMALFNVTFTIVSSVIPVALIACGSAYGIHMLTHYYIALEEVPLPITRESHKEAIFKGIKEVFVPVLLAGLTTIAGFLSLITSPIGPLHSFAIFTAFGITFSLILALTFIPALLIVKPLKRVGYKSKHMEKVTNKVKAKIASRTGTAADPELGGQAVSYNIYRVLCGTKPRLFVFSFLVVLFSFIGLKRLVVDTALINYFPADSKLRTDVDYVDKRFAGTNSMYLVIKSDKKGGMTNPEILESVDKMQDYITEKYEGVGKIISFTTFIKRMNQVMHIPESAETYAAKTAQADTTGPAVDSFDTVDSFDSAPVDSFDTGAASAAPAVRPDYVDPNIAYADKLAQPMTVQDGLTMISNAYAEAGGTHATVDGIVNILEQKLNYNGTAYYEIPYDTAKYPAATREQLSDLVSQYLQLLAGSDSLKRFADNPLSPSTIKVQVQLRSHSTDETGKMIKDIEGYAKRNFPKGYSLEITGPGEMEYTMTSMVISSQISSLVFSLACVFVLIAFSFRSVWAGLLGSLPLAFAIILNYMTMGFAGIRLDLVTSIIASVAVGVGIDYTIHFLETYRTERAASDDLDVVAKRTFRKSGHGIITNALAVGLGFLVLYFSKFVVLRYIGVLVAIVMFTSSALAMTIIPGVLTNYDPKFMRPKEAKK